jgi:hypothetical protein
MTRRVLTIAMLAAAALLGRSTPAAADVTAFFGSTSAPTSHGVKGTAVGVGLIIVGFEFEYAQATEDPTRGVPGLTTGMGNVLVQTPSSKRQIYFTAGAGLFRETTGTQSASSYGTNVGGGVKLKLAGPLRLRLDYRVFTLHGDARYPNPQRFYAGLNVSF